MFWLCDHTNIISVRDNFWPRFLKYDLSELSGKMKSGAVNIREMIGYMWTGPKRLCGCEWMKLDCYDTDLLVDVCEHSGDKYTGETLYAAETESQQGDQTLANQPMENLVFSDAATEDNAADTSNTHVSANADNVMNDDRETVHVDVGLSGDNMVALHLVEGDFAGQSMWMDAKTYDAIEEGSENEEDDERNALFDKYMNDGFEGVGYDMTEIPIPSPTESELNERRNRNIVQDCEENPDELRGFIKEAGNCDATRERILNELFDFHNSVNALKEMNNQLLEETERLREEKQNLTGLNNELLVDMEVLQREHDVLAELNEKCRCKKKPMKQKAAKIKNGPGKGALKLNGEGNKKNTFTGSGPALRISSMIRRIKKRSHRIKKRDAEFKYQSNVKKGRTKRTRNLKTIPMSLNDAAEGD